MIAARSYLKYSITYIVRIAVFSVFIIAIPLMSVTALTTTANNNHNNNLNLAFAQTQGSNNTVNTNATDIDTFRARGQISSLASDTLAGRPSSSASEMWVLGGDWEFGVSKGNLSNLAVDISMSKIDGKEAHHHTIESLRNATGAILPGHSQQIALIGGNHTDFKGIADITTNGEIKWRDVPIVVHLMNGNVVNFNIGPTKTDDHFKGLPVFGTVESIIDQSGKELLKQE
jgi:hypothetical protein